MVLVVFAVVLYYFCSQKIVDNPEVEMSKLPTYEPNPEEEEAHRQDVQRREAELARDDSVAFAIGKANTQAFENE